MFGDLIKSAVGVVTDTAKIAAAPIAAAVDVTRQVTKPLAEAAEETVAAIKGDGEEEDDE